MIKDIESLSDKKILILGFAREGQSTLKFLRNYYPEKHIALADKKDFDDWDKKAKAIVNNDKNLVLSTGVHYLDDLNKSDIIFKSPGIPNKTGEIKKARENGLEITSQAEVFFRLCRGKIIAITGTKGKSTTASLIYHILKNSGFDCELVGNIGKPALDYLQSDNKDKYYIFEISSHQLANLKTSPHIGVLLNIFREHLDYYESFKEYLEAKGNITRYQKKKDVFIYNLDFEEFKNFAKNSRAKKLAFSLISDKADCFIKNESIILAQGGVNPPSIDIGNLPLVGRHNIYNVMASILVSRSLGIDNSDIKKFVLSFKPLKNRLEIVGKYNDITFICDSLATIPEATIAALDAYKEKVDTLICGGFDRKQDFSGLAKRIVNSNLNNLILFPTTGKRIWNATDKINSGKRLIKHYFVDNMADAVKTAFQITRKKKVCLLSAASPSFSVFKNYEEESGQYKKYIKKYGQY